MGVTERSNLFSSQGHVSGLRPLTPRFFMGLVERQIDSDKQSKSISFPRQVEFERTSEKCKEAEIKINELEEHLNVVGQNMKTLELSETQAFKRHEDSEEKIRFDFVFSFVCLFV